MMFARGASSHQAGHAPNAQHASGTCSHDVLEDVLGDEVRPKLGRACAPFVPPVDELMWDTLASTNQEHKSASVATCLTTKLNRPSRVRSTYSANATCFAVEAPKSCVQVFLSKSPTVQNQRRLQEPKGKVCNRWKPRTNSHEVATAHRLWNPS